MSSNVTRRTMLASAVILPFGPAAIKAGRKSASHDHDDQPQAHYFSMIYEGAPHGVYRSREACQRDFVFPETVKRIPFVPLEHHERFFVATIERHLAGAPYPRRLIASPTSLVQVPNRFETCENFLQEVGDQTLSSRTEALRVCADGNAELLTSLEEADQYSWCVVAEFGQPLPKARVSFSVGSEGVMEGHRVITYPVRVLRPSRSELASYPVRRRAAA